MQLYWTFSTLRSRLGGAAIGEAVKWKGFILPAPASHSTLITLTCYILPAPASHPTLTLFCIGKKEERPSDVDLLKSRRHSVLIFSRQALSKTNVKAKVKTNKKPLHSRFYSAWACFLPSPYTVDFNLPSHRPALPYKFDSFCPASYPCHRNLKISCLCFLPLLINLNLSCPSFLPMS